MGDQLPPRPLTPGEGIRYPFHLVTDIESVEDSKTRNICDDFILCKNPPSWRLQLKVSCIEIQHISLKLFRCLLQPLPGIEHRFLFSSSSYVSFFRGGQIYPSSPLRYTKQRFKHFFCFKCRRQSQTCIISKISTVII